jgi:hypothetical protein
MEMKRCYVLSVCLETGEQCRSPRTDLLDVLGTALPPTHVNISQHKTYSLLLPRLVMSQCVPEVFL